MRQVKHLSLAAITATVAACSGPQDFMSGGGPAARSIASLGWFAMAILILVTVLVWLLIGVILFRRRGSFGERASIDPSADGYSWIAVGGFAVPAGVLALLLALSVSEMKAFPMEHDGGAAAPLIRIIGQQWWFDSQYLIGNDDESVHVPGEIHIPTGCSVDLELVSRDVIHSFWIPKLHGKVDLVPGLANSIRIEADQPGTYDGECGEFCGVQHAHMRLRIVAEDAETFMHWLDAQRADAAEPLDDQAKAGKRLFEGGPCAACHTVRGTAAHGLVGPDLTHFASRRKFAGYSIQNNSANVAAWITHAQSLKPGAQMPDMTFFTGAELNQLTAYLQALK